MPKLKQLPDDCTFPQLATVLDADRFAACLQAGLGPDFASGRIAIRALRLRRVYYKPGRSCRITFEIKLRTADGRSGEQLYFAKLAAPPKPAALYHRALRGALAAPEFGPAVALVRELGLVLWAYPNDPNLPGLATLASQVAMADLVRSDPARFGLPAECELVDVRLGRGKYVPGQRCGYFARLRWHAPSGLGEHRLYAKAYRRGYSRAAHAILQQLAASDACRSGRLRVPMTYGHDPEREIVWQEMLPGRSFAKEASARDLAAWAGPVGASLAAFHSSRLELGPGLGLEQELEELRASSRRIAAAYPEYAGRVAALRQRLEAAAPTLPRVPAAPVHGSFKTSHIFDSGGQVAFIDFDGAGIGDPTYDVGRFLAHLAASGIDAGDALGLSGAADRFREAYGDGVPWGWPAARVRWYTAAHLVSSDAYKCVKRLAPARVDAVLGAAESWFPAG